MGFEEDKSVFQREGESPRRFFTDHHHFDLYVWYAEEAKETIVGFQLVYREIPINTDSEFFISRFPRQSEEDTDSLHGETDLQLAAHAAPKAIQKAQNAPPESLFDKFSTISNSLPEKIRVYCEPYIFSKKNR